MSVTWGLLDGDLRDGCAARRQILVQKTPEQIGLEVIDIPGASQTAFRDSKYM